MRTIPTIPSDEAPRPRTISTDEAGRLVEADAVRLLDVRTPEEYRTLGHIRGAMLLPVDLIATAAATLPRDGKPILVYCEHGIRSVHAARFLSAAGFPEVLNMAGGMSCWRGARDYTPGSPCGVHGPSSWLVECAPLLPPPGNALDVACGRGRNALLLASAGWRVRAVDRDEEKLSALSDDAVRLGLPVETATIDLECGEVDLGDGRFDLILAIHYLHRPLFPALIRALKPGGLLVYETFTLRQAEHGHPKNPAFLLKDGELSSLVAPLKIIHAREGEFEGRWVSAVAAQRVEDAPGEITGAPKAKRWFRPRK